MVVVVIVIVIVVMVVVIVIVIYIKLSLVLGLSLWLLVSVVATFPRSQILVSHVFVIKTTAAHPVFATGRHRVARTHLSCRKMK